MGEDASSGGTDVGTEDASGDGTSTGMGGVDMPAQEQSWDLRVLTWNIEGLGSASETQYAAVASTLSRLGADVVCIQELAPEERTSFSSLASRLGYAATFVADEAPDLGGDILNACASRWELGEAESLGSNDLSADETANDMGRDIVAIRVLGADPTWPPDVGVGVFSLHLKAGQTATDRFRRQVELFRLSQAVVGYRVAHPGDATVVVGDLNHVVQDAANGRETFASPPSDLPPNYDLGSDVSFPVLVDPFGLLANMDFRLLRPFHEDTGFDVTHRPTTRRIDFIAIADSDDASVLISETESEIYDACKDDGVDADPPGGAIPKFGRPLLCAVSEQAADHWAVVADLRLTLSAP